MESSVIPIGPFSLSIQFSERGIKTLSILNQPLKKSKNQNTKSIQIGKLIQKCIQGNATAFDVLGLDVEGTNFQKKVWAATRKIPYGETRTYGQIAKAIGAPKAVRAVGTALGKNPVCIVVPCHRVVPSSGGIGEYAYGKAMKKWLLDHERHASVRPSRGSGHSA